VAVQPVYKVWIEEMNKRGRRGEDVRRLLATTAKYGRKP
jgi:hypothetical protein